MGEGIVAEFGTDTYMCAKSFQSCLTLCNPMACSPPGSCVHGILQARILECVVMLPPVDLPDLGIEPVSPALQADSLLLSHWGSPCMTWFSHNFLELRILPPQKCLWIQTMNESFSIMWIKYYLGL